MKNNNLKIVEIPTVEEYSRSYPKTDPFTKRLFMVLDHEEVSEETKNLLESIITEAANTAGLGITSPEIINLTYPLVMENLNKWYAEGIQTGLGTVMDKIPEEVLVEINYKIELERVKAKKRSLENEPINTLAEHLSAILESPLLPERLYNAILDEISEIYSDSVSLHSIENIETNLKSLIEKEKDSNIHPLKNQSRKTKSENKPQALAA